MPKLLFNLTRLQIRCALDLMRCPLAHLGNHYSVERPRNLKYTCFTLKFNFFIFLLQKNLLSTEQLTANYGVPTQVNLYGVLLDSMPKVYIPLVSSASESDFLVLERTPRDS